MTSEEKKTIDMLRQIRTAVETGALPLSQFPMEDLANLVDVTIGMEFCKMLGGLEKQHFAPLIVSLLNTIHHCVEKGDAEGCTKALFMLEEQYLCFDIILTAYKGQKFIEQYKMITFVAGESYSKLQYHLHQLKQKTKDRSEVILGTGKGVVYTTDYLSQVDLQQPEYINLNWDYICFTMDSEKWGTKDGVWEYRKADVENCEDKQKLQRICTMKPYEVLEEYDYSIWVNPSYKIVGDLELFMASYGREHSMLAFPTYINDDIYELMETGLNSDDMNIMMRAKYLQYEKEGYPHHYGMISDNILLRSHRDEKLCRVMDTWWEEALQCDRLWNFGFNYAAWKHDFDFALCDMFVEINPYFKNVVCDLEVKRDE